MSPTSTGASSTGSSTMTLPAGSIHAEPSIENLTINTIRTLAMDAVQTANSGHPGAPMALAPVAYTLWQEFLQFDPANPIWPNRDRFVLSNGHASMLLYAMLYLTGVKSVDAKYEILGTPSVSLDDIKHFRQLGSKTPGHPEYHLTSGVETTTGPLGQGVATTVGMAIAERWLAQHFNRPSTTLIDYRVYAFCSDGDLMEGVSSEAASLAGHLRLSNLCWVYDNNHITIEGKTNLAFNDDVAMRFQSYHWNVHHVTDANDLDALRHAFTTFRNTTNAPTLIIVDTHIGYGAPNLQDTSAAHGEPLGEEEVRLTKRAYDWPEDAKFYVPDGVIPHLADGIGKRGTELFAQWNSVFAEYTKAEPALAKEFQQMQHRELPEDWDRNLPTFSPDPKGIATRVASEKVLNVLGKNVPWLMGGAGDVGTSTKTYLTFPEAGDFESGADGFGSYAGRNLHFGIREHEMAAVANGLALSKIRPYASTYLIFSDYAKPAIRLSALMEIPVLYLFTHDSIGLGQDGPTHQPIEQLATLRAIPGLTVIRPADANEVTEAWRVAMQLRHEPCALILTRQNVPTFDRTRYAAASGLARGAYVMADAEGGPPDVLLLATGSEVSLCLSAHERLFREGIRARVVSMPSFDLFERQSAEYKDQVLPPTVSARVAVEQAATFGWERYVGRSGHTIGMTTFGASAPLAELQKKFGFTVDHVIEQAKAQIARHQRTVS